MENASRNNNKGPDQARQSPLSLPVILFVVLALILAVLAIKLFMGQGQSNSIINTVNIPLPAITPHPTTNTWQVETIEPGDTLAEIFYRNNLSQRDLLSILAVPKVKENLHYIKAENVIKLLISPKGRLLRLNYQVGLNQFLILRRTHQGFVAKIITKPLKTYIANAHNRIHSSFFNAAQASDIPTHLIFELANIFHWQIDFSKDIRPGDTFNILYEKKYLGDKFVAYGNILAAEFYVHGKHYEAVTFVDPKGKVSYYTPQGKSLAKAFIRKPVKYVYISSPFNLKRKHPILHYTRPHEGVDLAANRGTPVKASGNGRIKFVGRRGGYGNLVIIDHGRGITTRYGHLDHFAKGMKKGKWVKLGQTIAYVGSTGLATGPHLHFEYRINNVPHNPLTVKLPPAHPIARKYLKHFKQRAKTLVARLHRTMPSPYQVASR